MKIIGIDAGNSRMKVAYPDATGAPQILQNRLGEPYTISAVYFPRGGGEPVVGREHLRRIFTPEFEGPRRGYKPAGEIEARCDHGTIVRRLHEVLMDAGHEAVNDRRDLYILAGDEVTHLFEIKTDLSTTSLYQGVGQLMLYGEVLDPVPRRILVLPGQPKPATRQALGRLGITVLVFEWADGQVAFPQLADVLEQRHRRANDLAAEHDGDRREAGR